MGNIVLLDELTINQIAAGEVIERPASVIKEMVENSIDAGANKITVEIKNGGISYIKITDNGKGIAKDDLEIAFERHATSKIRSAGDLSQVTSMGFRGEALASIAAISNVELISKTQNDEVGNKIVVEAGNILEKEETACQKGTSITVKNLFFNTPVRYKFLKRDYTETGYIEDAITRIALVNPNISFKLINTGKTIIQTNGNGDLKSVIYSIYGKDVANGIVEVLYKYEDIEINGVVGKPEIARSNRGNQLFFVNKRYIKDKTLAAATEQGYKGMIPIGKFGFVVLNLTLNPSKVDVNVHPAKLEVRFEEENKIFQSTYHAIKDTLLKSELVENTENKIEKSENIASDIIKAKNNKINEEESQTTSALGSLFNFRKQNSEEIQRYTLEESKIKTNNILGDVFMSKQNAEANIISKEEEKNAEIKSLVQEIKNSKEEKIEVEKPKTGDPINTSDVLEELKKLKEKLLLEVDKNGVKQANTIKQETQENVEEIEYNLNGKSKIDEALEILRSRQEERRKANEVQENKEEVKSEEISELKKMPKISETSEINETQNVQEEQEIQEVQEPEKEQESNEEQVVEGTLNSEEVQNTEDTQEAQGTIEEHKEINETKITQEVSAEVENLEEPEKTEEPEETEEVLDIEKEIEYIKEKIESQNPEILEEDKEKAEKEFEEIKEKIEDLSNNTKVVSGDFKEMYAKLFGRTPIDEEEIRQKEEQEKLKAVDIIKDNVTLFEEKEDYNLPTYKFIGIAFNTYIIIEIEKEMYILDQHAAHERIMYEKVKNNYYSDKTKDSQMLILPDVITLSHKEVEIAKENIPMFEKAGFTLEWFGDNTIKLEGVPTVCVELDTKELFLETLDEINTVARTAKQEKEEKFIATVACKAAIKGNMALTKEEVTTLMDKLLILPNPFTCPHGRPTAIKMTKYDIERKFARK